MSGFRLFLAPLLALTVDSAPADPPASRPVLQFLPSRISAGVERRDRFLAARLPRPREEGAEFVIERDKTWGPGATVTVAFLGGSTTLRDKVAQAARTWEQHGRVTFSFKKGASYRTWTPQDTSYSSQIRIGFSEAGYWSAVGTDSADPLVVRAGEASMNLEGFDSRLPADWRSVVLHEFGHALGFHHEHQNPDGGCQDQFRWHDDPGYVPTRGRFLEFVPDEKGRRPGLYTELGGPPNNWPKEVVDFNLAKLPDGRAYTTSTFDPASIMKYFFEPVMFVDGEKSRCYSKSSDVLSDADKRGAGEAYPTAPQAVEVLRTRRVASLRALLALTDLSPDQRRHYETLLSNFSPAK